MLRGLVFCMLFGIGRLCFGDPLGFVSDRHGSCLARFSPGRVEYPQGTTAAHLLIGLNSEVLPTRGENLFLTLELPLQKLAETQIAATSARGAAVLMDLTTGEILVLASAPSFKPVNAASKEVADDEDHPLINRVLAGFAPGAAFLPVTSLAAASQDVIDVKYDCAGGFELGAHFMKCWIHGKGEHGILSTAEGFKFSCNPFFYQQGIAAGPEAIERVGKLLGLGQLSGLPLSGEHPGILPGPAWLESVYQEKWTDARTANTSIGQGYVLASPLQMVGVAAAIGNGGMVYKPRLLLRKPTESRGKLSEIDIDARELGIVRAGMWNTMNDPKGTGYRARPEGFEMAGRTGTAQNWKPDGTKDNVVWFMGFAPFEKPKFAVVVLLQGQKSGAVAAPIAVRLLTQALGGVLRQE